MSDQPIIKIHPLPHDDKPIQKQFGQLAVDIYQTPNEIVIIAPIAGVDKDHLHLSITDDVLVIQGERKRQEGVNEEQYHVRECFWGPFSRSIVLPLEANIQNVGANFDLNILTIRIPKTEKEHNKIIKIAA